MSKKISTTTMPSGKYIFSAQVYDGLGHEAELYHVAASDPNDALKKFVGLLPPTDSFGGVSINLDFELDA